MLAGGEVEDGDLGDPNAGASGVGGAQATRHGSGALSSDEACDRELVA